MKSLYTRWLPAIAASALLPALACTDSHGGTRKGRGISPAATAAGPQFPGAGRSGAGLSLAAGNVTVSCDEPGPIPGGSFGPAPGAVAHQDCYFDADHPDDPAATMEWIVEAAAEGPLVHARLTFNPRFVDNTYGANAIGWDGTGVAPLPTAPMMGKPKPAPKPGKSGHTFKDLVGSDHAEFTISDAAGVTKLKFKADYLTASAGAPSGYASLGVSGGEGKMLIGDASDVVAVSTSLDRNLNACGLGDFLVDSPATDANYTPNNGAANWDFRVVYDVWLDADALGSAGFGRASVEFVHASPSKAGTNTIEVTPGECPPGWPPYCSDPDGCGSTPTEPPAGECGDLLDELCTVPSCDGGVCETTDSGTPLAI